MTSVRCAPPFVKCFVDRHARWDNGACGSPNGSSAPTFSRQFRASRASIACTTPRALLYVGKARNLRRRLAQYRTARRTKKDRKRRTLVRSADRIEWQVCASLFSDQSAWARGRCRDTADRAGVPEIVPHGPLQGAIGRIATHPCARGRAMRTDERRYPFAAAGSRSENPVLSCLWLWLIVRLRLREVWPRKSSRSGTGPSHPA